MVTGSKFTLSLAQVERTAVGFSITGYQEYDESDDGRDMALDNQPVPRTGVIMNKNNHVFANNITKKLTNNKETFCSYNNTNKEESRSKDSRNINQKINDIFNYSSYIY